MLAFVEKETFFCPSIISPEPTSAVLLVHVAASAVHVWLNMKWSLAHTHLHVAQRSSASCCCWHLILTPISIKENTILMHFSLKASYPKTLSAVGRPTVGRTDRQTDRSMLLFTFNHFCMSSTITSSVSLGCPIMCALINHRPACKPQTSLSIWQAPFWLIILYPLTCPGSERRPILQFNLHIFSP